MKNPKSKNSLWLLFKWIILLKNLKKGKRIIYYDINQKKSLDFDIITEKILQQATRKWFKVIIQIFDAIIKTTIFQVNRRMHK